MYSAEVLSQLRSLNWLTREIHRVPAGSREGALLQTQIDGVRARLPESILNYHDQLAIDGKPSATEVIGGTCGGCHAPLPKNLVEELLLPGHFGVCANCGLFLWAEESVAAASACETKRSSMRGSEGMNSHPTCVRGSPPTAVPPS
jgi:predicted  nucleic acid-binding Zn-ribbon protein